MSQCLSFTKNGNLYNLCNRMGNYGLISLLFSRFSQNCPRALAITCLSHKGQNVWANCTRPQCPPFQCRQKCPNKRNFCPLCDKQEIASALATRAILGKLWKYAWNLHVQSCCCFFFWLIRKKCAARAKIVFCWLDVLLLFLTVLVVFTLS